MDRFELRPSPDAERAGAGSNGCLLAIDFGGTKIAMATANLAGDVLLESQIPTHAHEGADAVISRMFDAARALISKTVAQTGAPLVSVAAVTPGIVEAQGIKLAPNNPGWERLPLADVLRQGFDVRCICVETDVKAAALAEARKGALAGVDCGLYLNLGTGLAAAAVLDGKVLRGAHGAAGEIAYQLRGTAGEVPFAQGGAPFEDLASGRAIGDRASAMLGRPVTTAEAFELGLDDARIAALIDETLAYLGVQVANMALLLDPSRIVIGGGMSHIARIHGAIRSTLAEAVPYPPEVRRSSFGPGAALQGALILAGERWGRGVYSSGE
ncbi:ROK family protein [Trinickia diaoshuihuensis]|jgi:glucokinase|uniref:ROK family protein n=1 Tax=Trinickia diaoshuihuensis TaxID=2292265 RepID=UPI000E2755B8|nr:ROK family protein [Trinickia diaoshuihuensis]